MSVILVLLLLSCSGNVCNSVQIFGHARSMAAIEESQKPSNADEDQRPLRINKVIKLVEDDRRRSLSPHLRRLSVNELPESEALLPGHSLIRPAKAMLKSAVNFPHDDQNLVYGNLDNLGITFDKTSQRDLYGGFRKNNDFLATLVKAIKEVNENDEREKQTPSVILLQPKHKAKKRPKNSNKLAEITMKALNILEGQDPDSIKIITKPKPLSTKKKKPSVILVQQKLKPKSKTPKKNKFKEITMKALDFLDNHNPLSPPKESKSEFSIPSSFKDAVKSLVLLDNKKIATFFKPFIKLIENKNNKKEQISKAIQDRNNQMILTEPQPRSILKSPIGNKLKEITMRILKYISHFNSTLKKSKQSINDKLDEDKDMMKQKKMQELLNIGEQIESETISPADVLLNERTKKIQDFLNSHIPIINAQPLKEDSKSDRTTKVQEFLNNHVPIREERDKLSLIEKTKNIQDFLNNQVPIFLNRDSLNDRNNTLQGFFGNFDSTQNRTTQIDETENNANEVLDLNSSEEKPDYRRMPKKKKKKYRQRDSKYESKDDEESGLSASSDYEKNPGNPFTIHRNKYVQNWLWNHFMDGDHMNINPFAPPFASLGPSGADLFFGRKWWYFNQDDYKPMG